MRRHDDRLLLDYVVTNHLSHPIKVAEAVTNKNGALPGRVVVQMRYFVQGDAKPNPIAFVKQSWQPTFPTDVDGTNAQYRTLAAGARRHGSAYVPLPIAAWGPVYHAMPLHRGERSALLLIQYFDPTRRGDIPRTCDDGFIVGEVLSLPDGVDVSDAEWDGDENGELERR